MPEFIEIWVVRNDHCVKQRIDPDIFEETNEIAGRVLKEAIRSVRSVLEYEEKKRREAAYGQRKDN